MADAPAGSCAELIHEHPVIVFSKTFCPYCNETKKLLLKKSIAYNCIEMDENPNGTTMQAELTKMTG